MREQRSRRAVLQAAGGLAATAGCLGGGRSAPVRIIAAGSLTNALSNTFAPSLDTPVEIETHGSARLARMVSEGLRDPDIVVVADTALFDRPMSPSWYSVFTSNAVVLAYNESTDGGRRLGEATDRWPELLASGELAIGRTDPRADPLGYRTLFLLELAERQYGVDDLASRILSRDQIHPESSLISRFETGSLDAAFAYRNMATERGYDYIDLPDRIDLSDPALADWYSSVSYTLPGGSEVQGSPISYGATARTVSEKVLSVFERLLGGEYLEQHGFIPRESFPAHRGSVPERIKSGATNPQ